MAKLTITTIKGAKIELDGAAATVNGKTFSFVKMAYDAAIGHHIDLGQIKAQTRAEDLNALRAHFERAGAELEAEHNASPKSFSDRIEARMYGRSSNH